MSMTELDRIAEEHIRSKGGVPTSKGYKGFPAALCISPNSMVVHGIPSDYRARGNLVGIHGDRPIDAVFSEIQEALEQAGARA